MQVHRRSILRDVNTLRALSTGPAAILSSEIKKLKHEHTYQCVEGADRDDFEWSLDLVIDTFSKMCPQPERGVYFWSKFRENSM